MPEHDDQKVYYPKEKSGSAKINVAVRYAVATFKDKIFVMSSPKNDNITTCTLDYFSR